MWNIPTMQTMHKCIPNKILFDLGNQSKLDWKDKLCKSTCAINSLHFHPVLHYYFEVELNIHVWETNCVLLAFKGE